MNEGSRVLISKYKCVSRKLILTLICTMSFLIVSGFPVDSEENGKLHARNWTKLIDEWIRVKERVSQRAAVTLLPYTNRTHVLPSSISSSGFEKANFEVLRRMNFSRMLWEMESAQQSGHLSLFVDKAMKLLDLRKVMIEIETSVMSKVSCTACKVGAGLLQHFIKSGKSEDEIVKSIFQFCVSLKLQSSRVCQGITLLMGMEKTIDYPSTAQQFIDDFVLDLLEEEAPLLEEKPSDSVPIKFIPNPAIPLFTLPGGAEVFLHTKRNVAKPIVENIERVNLNIKKTKLPKRESDQRSNPTFPTILPKGKPKNFLFYEREMRQPDLSSEEEEPAELANSPH